MLNAVRSMWRLRSLVQDRRGTAIVGVLFAVVEAVLVIPIPWLVARSIDTALPEHDRGALALYAGGVIGCTLLSTTFAVLAKSRLLGVTRLATARMRSDTTSRLIAASRQFHTDADEAFLHDALVTDAARIDQMASVLIGDVVPSLLTIVGMVIALLIVNVMLTGVTALLLPTIVIVHSVFKTRRHLAVAAFHGAYERFSAGVLRLLRTDEMIRVEGTGAVVQADQDSLIADLQHSGRRSLLLDAMHDGAQVTLISFVAAAILFVGGILVIDGDVRVGQLISFYAAFGLLRRPIAYLATATGLVNAGSLALGHLDDLTASIDREPYAALRTDVEKQRLRVTSISTLALEAVDFGYPNRPMVLRSFSLTVNRGEVVGLAGPNGSGKSTVTQLLLGVYRPAHGTALVNGKPYDTVDVMSVRARIGVVPQHAVFLSGTLDFNLRLGIHTKDLDWALQTSGADSVVAALPDGLATMLGDDGVRLSGGQRQRISIARALLRDPDVLILDEPTLHLDVESVARVLEIVRGERGVGVVLVSHQADVLAVADRVLTLGS